MNKATNGTGDSTTATKDSAKIWALSTSDMMDDDVNLMDQNEMLEEGDLVRPDPASLKGRQLNV